MLTILFMINAAVVAAEQSPVVGAPRQDTAATVTALLRLQQEIFLTQTALAESRILASTKTPTAAFEQTARPSPTSVPGVEIMAPRLALRVAPGTTAAVLGLAEKGQQFYVTRQADDCSWLEVVLDNGSDGWVTGDPELVHLTVPCSTLASTAVTSTPTASTVRRSPTATSAPVASATPTRRSPTSTLTPTRTVSDGTATTPTASFTPEATSTIDATTGPYTAVILAPVDGQSSRTPVTFSWTADAQLGVGQEFEVVFWRPSDVESSATGLVRSSAATTVSQPVGELAPDTYRWSLWLVQPEPYIRIRRLAGPFTLTVPSTTDNNTLSGSGSVDTGTGSK